MNCLVHSGVKQEHTGRAEITFELGLEEGKFRWKQPAVELRF